MSKTEAEVMPGPQQGQPPPPPEIFSAIWHPHKTWVDVIVGFLFSWILPLEALPYVKDKSRKDDRIAHARKMRETYTKMVNSAMSSKNSGFRRWARLAGCDIVEATIPIPRQDDLLQKWGIVSSSKDEPSYSLPADSNCTVHVAFPVTLLPDEVDLPTKTNEHGCLVLEDNDILTKLSKEVLTVLFFHGGGLTIGSPHSFEGIDALVKALEGRTSECRKLPTAILVSVQYSLAPDYPFPAAPMEACSVVSHLLDQGFQLHIFGLSAGGNLALVAGIEAFRAHEQKGNIRSIFVGCPMIDPACDSVSYYQNSTSSYACPVPWIRWCYQVYLDLPAEDNSDQDNCTDEDDLSNVLGRNSNRRAWSESKWAQSSLRRLAEPIFDVPANLQDGPKFLISTNAADPLHDDGAAMVEKLRASRAHVSHHDDKGSHWIGTSMDTKAYQELIDDWADYLFGK